MRRHAMLLCLVLLAMTGCGGRDFPTAPMSASPVVGSYTLRSRNGAPLPYLFQDFWEEVAGLTGITVALTSRQLTVAANGTWIESSEWISYWDTSGATSVRQPSGWGTWTDMGSSISFRSDRANQQGTAAYTGMFDGTSTLSLVSGGIAYVFTK